MASTAPPGASELARRLREADAATLLELLGRNAGELSAAEARQALANPFLDRAGIEALVADRRLAAATEIRRLVAVHPRTPEPLALTLVPGLAWRDLVEVGLETRARPVVRRAAERYLVARLPGLAIGERVAVARRAPAGVLPHFRRDPHPRVMTALLANPRLTEGTLVRIAADETTARPVLAAIARDRRWSVRPGVRSALARNPRTPVDAVLPLLPLLTKRELAELAADRRLPPPVRQRGRLLGGG